MKEWENISGHSQMLYPGFVSRKNLFCKHCKQGKIGCPAYEGMQGKKL